MTTVTFFKSGGVYYGFEEKGHTGYDEAGQDILCAALSSMTMLVVNACEVCYASNVEYSFSEDSADSTVIVKSALPKYESDEKKQYAVAGLIQAYYFQLMDLVEEYYEYLDVREIEREI